jgi:hypothetical protein
VFARVYDDPTSELATVFGAPLDRRRFLQGSAVGLAFLGLGSLLPAGCARYPTPSRKMVFFTAKEYAVVNQAAERLLGVAGQVGPEEDQVDVAGNLDAWLATWDADAQQQLRIMLRVFEHGTSLFDLQRKRFTRLGAAAKDQYIDGWMRSTLGARRAVFRGLKALSAAGFYQDPGTWKDLGYDGPWLGRVSGSSNLEREAVVPLTAVLDRRA